MMCRIVNTAEYCGDVVPQLEAMMKQLIKSHIVDEVNFAPEVSGTSCTYPAQRLPVVLFRLISSWIS